MSVEGRGPRSSQKSPSEQTNCSGSVIKQLIVHRLMSCILPALYHCGAHRSFMNGQQRLLHRNELVADNYGKCHAREAWVRRDRPRGCIRTVGERNLDADLQPQSAPWTVLLTGME